MWLKRMPYDWLPLNIIWNNGFRSKPCWIMNFKNVQRCFSFLQSYYYDPKSHLRKHLGKKTINAVLYFSNFEYLQIHLVECIPCFTITKVKPVPPICFTLSPAWVTCFGTAHKLKHPYFSRKLSENHLTYYSQFVCIFINKWEKPSIFFQFEFC